MSKLSDNEWSTLTDCLSAFPTKQSALAEFERRTGRTVSKKHLSRIIKRRTGGPAKDLLGGGFDVEVDWCDEPLGKPKSKAEETVLESYQRRTREQKLVGELKDLVERLDEANARNAVLSQISGRVRPPRIARRERTSGLREGTAVALASDWHVEENVYPEQVAGRNEYSPAISTQRSERYFDSVLSMVEHNRASFQIRDLVLWAGGDLITGYIHPELVEDNDLSPVQAVLLVRDMWIKGIHTLLADKKLERIVIPCSHGNHGRTTEKRRIKTAAINSYEWLLYNVLQTQFADEKRVEFVIDQSAHQYVDAYDYDGLHFHHGDELKYGGGVGGLAIPLLKRVPAWDRVRPSTYHHIGHFHQLRDFGRAIVNGSLIGYNDFAMSIGADFEVPQQAFYILDSKRGKCQVTPLWCDVERKAKVA